MASGQVCARRYHQKYGKEYYARPEVKAHRKKVKHEYYLRKKAEQVKFREDGGIL
jgi:hypothetical protein